MDAMDPCTGLHSLENCRQRCSVRLALQDQARTSQSPALADFQHMGLIEELFQ
jgi:hypothetical protein